MLTEDFGPVIHTYTREQAIADGWLVDLSEKFPSIVRDAGMTVPVAASKDLYDRAIALTDAAREMCNDEKGRVWDVVFMFAMATRGVGDVQKLAHDTMIYTISCVQDRPESEQLRIKAVIGPDYNFEPVLTLMLEHES